MKHFPRVARIALALTAIGLVSGCAVYPAPVAYQQPVYGPAPVMAAPAPVYYGPAVYPSFSIYGRFGGGGHHRR